MCSFVIKINTRAADRFFHRKSRSDRMLAGLVNVRDLSDLIYDRLKNFSPCLVALLETDRLLKGNNNFESAKWIPRYLLMLSILFLTGSEKYFLSRDKR